MSEKRYTLRPSRAERWMNCPGSEYFERRFPDRGSDSIFAREGRIAHKVAARILTGETIAPGFIEMDDDTGNFWEVSETMLYYVNLYVSYVRHVILFLDCSSSSEVYIEHKVAYGKYSFGDSVTEGTADLLIWDASKSTLFVGDLKFGQGIVVEVMYNPQIMIYACAAIESLGIPLPDKIVFIIAQPRREDFRTGEIFRLWEVDGAYLSRFTKSLNEKITRALVNDKGVFATGEHCHFCPSLTICPALRKIMEVTFSNKQLSKIDSLTEGQLGYLKSYGKLIKKFVDSADKESLKRAQSGKHIPGFKLAQSYGYREWENYAEAEKELRRRMKKAKGDAKFAYEEPKLISPAQAETVFGRGVIDHLTHKPERGLILIPEDDDRPEYSPNDRAIADFKD